MDTYPVTYHIGYKWDTLEIDTNSGERWRRTGQCLRCGKCCIRGVCQSYDRECLNGVIVSKCNCEYSKPFQCKLFPDSPFDPTQNLEGCGYHWERVK